MQKYNITSGSVVVSMIFTVNRKDNVDSESVTVHAAVDILNERVYFVGDEISGIDYQELENEILQYVKPSIAQVPEIPAHVLSRIDEVRRGQFEGQNIYKM